MQIYFIRHGKTEWNRERKFQGAHGDSPLLPQSLADIQKLGHYLSATTFTGFYSSPLKRAYQTAKRLKQSMDSPLTIKCDERLREFDLGAMEGLNFAQASRQYPQQVAAIWDQPEKYDGQSIGGEDYLEVIKRGKSFAQEIAQNYSDDNDKVIAVSHGAALSAIMGGLLNYPLADIRQNGALSNTSLSILETTNQGKSFHLIVWNETSFLGRKIIGTDSL